FLGSPGKFLWPPLGGLPTTVAVDPIAVGFLLYVDRCYDALATEALRGTGNEIRCVEDSGIDRDLVCPEIEVTQEVVDVPHAAAGAQRDEAVLAEIADHRIEKLRVTALRARDI